MSVIVGRINLNNDPIKESVFREVLNKVNFFKADKTSLLIKEKIGLGSLLLFHTPKSTIDKQPYTHPNYPVSIVADVRLDNRNELIQNLSYPNAAISDTELILHTYIKYQEKCLQYLIGAFTFIIWDERNQKLFCARDQMGVRPFNYYFNNKRFIACSIAKGITNFPDANLSINEQFIKNTFLVSKTPAIETFHEHIKILLPAHYLVLQQGTIKIHKYWELDTTKRVYYKNPEDYVLDFKEKFSEAVKCRIKSPQNIGVELSGGLDSSGIAVTASRLLKDQGKDLYAYSYIMNPTYKGKYFPYEDESHLVNDVCRKGGITKVTKIMQNNFSNLHDQKDLSLWLYEGINFKDGIKLDALREKAQEQNVNVLLSGYLGDHLVTSFAREYYLAYLEEGDIWKYFKSFLSNKGKVGKLSLLGMLWMISKYNPQLANKIYHKTSHAKIKPHPIKYEKFFLSPYFVKQHPFLKLENHLKNKYTDLNFSFRQTQKEKIGTDFPHQRLFGENTAGLYRRMRTRYPLGDIRLLQYVLSLPIHQKRNQQYQRLIFRRGLADLLPDSITWRNVKMGPTMPFEPQEYIEKWHDRTVDWLNSLKKDGKFDFINLDKIIEKEILRKKIGNLPKDAIMLRGKVGQIQLILRYIELNGNISSSIFKKSSL